MDKKYKITLSDNSFFIVDKDYKLCIFYMMVKKVITVEEYLSTNKYKKYYMFDKINKDLVKRTFTIEETTEDLPIGKRFKYVEDIQVGDLVCGIDNEPNKIEELHSGEDEMFEIECDGETLVVNGGHILALVDKDTGEHLEMPVNVFMHMNEEFHSHYVMEKVVN